MFGFNGVVVFKVSEFVDGFNGINVGYEMVDFKEMYYLILIFYLF